jgi:hypothetical protein
MIPNRKDFKHMQKIAALAAGLLLATGALAQDAGSRRETVGVDAHYMSAQGNDSWSGAFSYGRLIMSNLEIAGAYTFSGGNHGADKVQGLQGIGRQWFGTFGRADSIVPFVQLGVGLEFANSKYENVVGLGGGVGMFVSNQSELRLTAKREWGGFVDATHVDMGFYYHF